MFGIDPQGQRQLMNANPREKAARRKARILGLIGAGLSGIPIAGPMINAGVGFVGDEIEQPYDEERMRRAAMMRAAQQLARPRR